MPLVATRGILVEGQPALTRPLLRATDPRQGNISAPITIFDFGDFSCPACKEFQPILDSAIAQFPGKILHVWKDFPLPIHPFSPAAHRAAACANEQGKFWEYHDRLFTRASPAEQNYDVIATELNLDLPRFTTCQNDATIQTRIQESFDEGRLLQIDQTPYLFINDERVAGLTDKETLVKIIERKLKL
ncbi:MAG: thioredoxin domain-containing protein [bacterium]|nr:thioredoxin domain-containing protein [bacterium]